MNKLNYASLSASKKLAENWVVLETDFVWRLGADGWKLLNKDWVMNMMSNTYESYPAPSFAEIWRELLKLADNNEKIIVSWIQEMNDWQATGADVALLIVEVCSNIEKLAELLIWVKGQKVNHYRP